MFLVRDYLLHAKAVLSLSFNLFENFHQSFSNEILDKDLLRFTVNREFFLSKLSHLSFSLACIGFPVFKNKFIHVKYFLNSPYVVSYLGFQVLACNIFHRISNYFFWKTLWKIRFWKWFSNFTKIQKCGRILVIFLTEEIVLVYLPRFGASIQTWVQLDVFLKSLIFGFSIFLINGM